MFKASSTVTSWSETAGSASVDVIRQAQHDRQSKIEALYSYLAGPQFRQRVEAIFKWFSAQQDDLEQEK